MANSERTFGETPKPNVGLATHARARALANATIYS
jgi:hypothetical protein